ncbi:Retrotransposon-derived protein PEG10 [Colletotrichum fructicola Nara gc5]|uniref:Retrotransposon-derived protein PEG10 n=1 Tax=Colletotrichum fructicola (strain Nara gc5) TaxID=1213859 RepID=A0A7J6IE35_COLFN|nr:Retrotransposon-derived protein PEG10 [Colletotrichum fructicola Nara gc5]KAF4476757.1 Retrotransposon-derived protein PEG10 [Colletotrichum fructicola Nara gc5]KAF4477361.1 Retrotransposon-derived protein PEG10 [Colletotrichum fructicola Nara gc5]KAF4488625.1 Retrotransposon-derived protein PEG10 [Colletotrichum fructicola Nara gc5]
MSSRASAKSPTPGSSSSSKQPVKSLAEELEGAPMAVDSDDEVTLKKETYDKLRARVKKGDDDIAKVQAMYNETANELQGLKQMIQELGNGPQRLTDLENGIARLGGQGSNPLIQELQNEVNTLRAAANIVTTPTGGRQKLKLSAPITYDGTPGQLKSFLIQVKNYQNFHHGDFTSQTEKVVHAATYLRGRALKWFEPIQEEFLKYETLDECSTETRDIYSSFQGFEDALRSLFQDPDEKRQAERDLAQLRQTKSTKEYAAMFRQLSIQLDLTEETKIFMFYQGLKDEVKDEIVKIDRPEDFLQYADLAIKIDNRLFERRKEKGEKRQGPNTGRKYQWQPQHKFNNQRNDNRPRSNWNNNRQSTAYGQHSGPMDLSMMTKPNDRKPWNPKCYNCNKQGHIAKDCRQPKKLPWKPVAERPRQVNTIAKASHASQSWTGCYDDDCRIHLEDKEMSGHYPRDSNPGRSGYDMSAPDTRPRTLAMMHSSNSRVARKPVEQLNEMLRIQRLEPITSHEDTRQTRLRQQESEEEPEHQHDPLTEQQLLSMTSNWTFGEGESSPYDSDEPRDVAQQRTQTEITYGFTPSVDDSSSEEEPDDQENRIKQLLKHQEIDMLQDKQQRHFYGTSANQRDRDYTPQLHTEDHPALRSNHRLHQTLFWPQCFHDRCKEHMGEKHDYQFYPRRHNDEPIREIYSTSAMIGWTMVLFEDNLAVFRPSPQFPMRRQHDNDMKWDERQQDECQVHYQEKARAWRVMKNGPRPPQIKIRENSLTKARREGKQITYPGHSGQSKN